MENRFIIIYKSKTGFTKRYAEMIAKKIGCAIAVYKTATIKLMSEYDTVILGSPVHASRIDGYEKAKAMFRQSSSKHFIVFATGATPNAAEEVIEELWKQNLFADELVSIPHFYCQSGLCYDKMPLTDKTMMKIFAALMKNKKDKSEYEHGFEQAISSSYDISSKDYIMPLVSFLKLLQSEKQSINEGSI